MIFGKLIGATIGFFSLGPVGVFIGLAAGHYFDRALKKIKQSESPEQLAAINLNFFNTTFTLIGYLAKSDGLVTQEEIDETQLLMEKMGLTAQNKREAIRLFKQGSALDFDPTETLNSFWQVCGNRAQLKNMLMVYLINTALADGKLHENEENNLRHIAKQLHFSHLAFEQLLKMIRAQESFSGGYYQSRHTTSNTDSLQAAYTALGVSADTSDKDIKKAYRKLMSEYHPDKLIGQGVPEDMVKVATKRSQEVQTAYDTIKKARKSS